MLSTFLLALAILPAQTPAKKKDDKPLPIEGAEAALGGAGRHFRASGRLRRQPDRPHALLRGRRVRRRLEDHQLRHHLDARLRRRRVLLDRLRGARPEEPDHSSGSAPGRTTASAASAMATASTSPTDGGKTWSNVGLKASEHIGKIVIDPRDSNTVYVAAQGPLWAPGRRPRACTKPPTGARPGSPCWPSTRTRA